MPDVCNGLSTTKKAKALTATVIFLPPFAITYEEARRNELLQEKINSERIRIRNWSLDKSSYEVAQAWIAWRKSFIGKIHLIESPEKPFDRRDASL